MALDITEEKGSDRATVSVLRNCSPRCMDPCFRNQAKNRESGHVAARKALVTGAALTGAALHDIVVTIRAHVDACLESTTS